MIERARIPSKLLISIAFSVSVFAALAALTDPGEIIQVVTQADLSLLGAALIVANAPLLIYAFTWQKIFEAVGIEISYFRSLRILLSNTFVNNITPFGNIGGEAAATYFITRISDQPPGKIFSAISASSLINFSPLLTLLALGLILNVYLDTVGFLLAVSAFSIVLLYLLKSLGLPRKILNTGRIPGRARDFLEDFRESFSLIKNSGNRIALLLSTSHVASLLDMFAVVLVGAAFGADLFSSLILIAVPLGRVSNYFPTPGGTGSYELAFTGLLVFFFNVSPATAVSIAITYRVLTYYTGILVGYAAILSLGFSSEVSEF